MSTRPVVFDLDGVLCDFALGFSRLASTIFLFEEFSTSKQKSWKEFRNRGLSWDDMGRVWNLVDSSDFWWETLPAFPTLESDRTWMNLLAEFADIEYITNRRAPDNVDEQSVRWLERHEFPEGRVHVTEEKAEYVTSTFSGVLGIIEDNPYNIEGYAVHRLPVYVRDWQFNRDVRPELPRVHTVKEFCVQMLEQTNE